MSIGYKIRSLLSDGFLEGFYDTDTISSISKELRTMNYSAVQNNKKNILVLKDFDPIKSENVHILNILDNYLTKK